MTDRIGDASGRVSLPRRPLLIYWLIAVAIEFVLAAVFVLTGADAAIEAALDKAGLDFATGFITAARALIAYPAATVGVVLSLLQVAAPDLAVLGVSLIRGGRALRHAVTGRFRVWSREVGAHWCHSLPVGFLTGRCQSGSLGPDGGVTQSVLSPRRADRQLFCPPPPESEGSPT